ncbi:hypothetical protein EYR40_008453 [Pleurotus pulmonarius]|nr:hypothetical protein EYR36_009271 [Pleurotus pulmonarius]KAF4592770.1 hypothetical protein EYR38_008470 [Pleurotus pulmonarius]KAF4593665.1 hypothetical protein EYR40_008453 [Pleurotus pulmonarius]
MFWSWCSKALTYDHLSSFLPTYRIWSLIDTPSGGLSSPPLISTMPDVFFLVHAASPNPSHHGERTTQHGGAMLTMNPWTIEELYDGLYDGFLSASRTEIDQAYKDCGPCIRDIIFDQRNPGALTSRIKAALASPSIAEQDNRFLLSGATAIEMVQRVRHELFYIRRKVTDDSQPLRPDVASIQVKTRYIAKKLSKFIA